MDTTPCTFLGLGCRFALVGKWFRLVHTTSLGIALACSLACTDASQGNTLPQKGHSACLARWATLLPLLGRFHLATVSRRTRDSFGLACLVHVLGTSVPQSQHRIMANLPSTVRAWQHVGSTVLG